MKKKLLLISLFSFLSLSVVGLTCFNEVKKTEAYSSSDFQIVDNFGNVITDNSYIYNDDGSITSTNNQWCNRYYLANASAFDTRPGTDGRLNYTVETVMSGPNAQTVNKEQIRGIMIFYQNSNNWLEAWTKWHPSDRSYEIQEFSLHGKINGDWYKLNATDSPVEFRDLWCDNCGITPDEKVKLTVSLKPYDDNLDQVVFSATGLTTNKSVSKTQLLYSITKQITLSNNRAGLYCTVGDGISGTVTYDYIKYTNNSYFDVGGAVTVNGYGFDNPWGLYSWRQSGKNAVGNCVNFHDPMLTVNENRLDGNYSFKNEFKGTVSSNLITEPVFDTKGISEGLAVVYGDINQLEAIFFELRWYAVDASTPCKGLRSLMINDCKHPSIQWINYSLDNVTELKSLGPDSLITMELVKEHDVTAKVDVYYIYVNNVLIHNGNDTFTYKTTSSYASYGSSNKIGFFCMDTTGNGNNVTVSNFMTNYDYSRNSNYYDLYFDGVDATGSMDKVSVPVNSSYKLPKNKFVSTGKVFEGWSSSRFGSVEFSDEETIYNLLPGGSAATLYPVFKNVDPYYTVIYDGNGATSGVMSNSFGNANKSITLKENVYKRLGYKFLGWSSSSKGSVEYNDKTTFNAINVGTSKTLYAIWEDVQSSNAIQTFISNFNAGVNCNNKGNKTLSERNALKAYWNNSGKNEFEALSIDEQYWFKGNNATNANIKDMVARYDYVYGVYSVTCSLNDFIGRKPALLTSNSEVLAGILNNSSNITIIIVSSLLACGLVVTVVAASKKKRINK